MYWRVMVSSAALGYFARVCDAHWYVAYTLGFLCGVFWIGRKWRTDDAAYAARHRIEHGVEGRSIVRCSCPSPQAFLAVCPVCGGS